MTEIHVISTGSKGNCYYIKSRKEILLLEVGVPMQTIVEALGKEYKMLIGAVVSHRHGDHFLGSTVGKLTTRGIPVYVGEDVLDIDTISHYYAGLRLFSEQKKFKVGKYIIQPFRVPHNVTNYGFLIITPKKERVVFVTDAEHCHYTFKDINCIMVECNHDDDTMLDNMMNYDEARSHPEFHMSLDECTEFCKANATVSTEQIILIHPSGANLDEFKSISRIKEELGINDVSMAHAGDKFVINGEDF